MEIDSTISVDEASSQAVAATASEQKIAAFANNEEEQTISAQSATYSVTAIGAHAFASSFSADIETITIPSEITSIGSYAFSGCSAITTITIPKSVTAIGANAFSGCSSLETIKNKSSLTIETGSYGIASEVTVTEAFTVTITFVDYDMSGVWDSFFASIDTTSITMPSTQATFTYTGDFTETVEIQFLIQNLTPTQSSGSVTINGTSTSYTNTEFRAGIKFSVSEDSDITVELVDNM